MFFAFNCVYRLSYSFVGYVHSLPMLLMAASNTSSGISHSVSLSIKTNCFFFSTVITKRKSQEFSLINRSLDIATIYSRRCTNAIKSIEDSFCPLPF